MIAAETPTDATGFVSAILRGETGQWPWPDDESASRAFRAVALRQRVEALLAYRLHETGWNGPWPSEVRRRLESRLRLDTARETVVERELVAVFAALGRAAVPAILMKGSALAYTAYPQPALRRRGDTDLVIRRADVERAASVLADAGYRRENVLRGERVSQQALFRKIDRHGVRHDLDVHWKISNRPFFEDMLNWDELEASAVPVPALGSHARAMGPAHALTMACVHPVAHHGDRFPDRFLWVYDVHLLVGAMGAADVEQWTALVRARQIRAICARALGLARAQFGTIVPPSVDEALTTTEAEPSAWYLSAEPWRGDIRLADLRTSRGLRAKAQLVREVVFPRPSYIRDEYGVSHPLLIGYYYLYRVARGCWRLFQRFRRASHPTIESVVR
jgi:hypothetical protein